MNYRCTKCGKTESAFTSAALCECGGLWELDYEPPRFEPDGVRRDEWSMFRYRRYLPLEGEEWRDVTLGEGLTPIVRLDSDVMLKLEYLMPTLSYKDRGAAVMISNCKAAGITRVVQDSSGNAGNSVAAYGGRAGIACEIYVPQNTSPKKIAMIRAHGATCRVIPGNRDYCAEVLRERVKQEGLYYASHVFNPFFVHGTKTMIYEVYEQLGRLPDAIFIPTGNGTMAGGALLAIEHLQKSGCIDRLPKLFIVQSERVAPLLAAMQSGAEEVAGVAPQPTLAEGIAIGKPMRGTRLLKKLRDYGASVITAPEDQILEVRLRLAEKGFYVEQTSAATYAAYLELVRKNGPIHDALIPMTGAGLKSDY